MCEKIKRRPFHETIVDAINGLTGMTNIHKATLIGDLIKATKIPKNHEQIAEVWEKLCMPERWWREYGDAVFESILEQKREAEAESSAKHSQLTVQLFMSKSEWLDMCSRTSGDNYGNHNFLNRLDACSYCFYGEKALNRVFGDKAVSETVIITINGPNVD
jgi:hypothetical protein